MTATKAKQRETQRKKQAEAEKALRDAIGEAASVLFLNADLTAEAEAFATAIEHGLLARGFDIVDVADIRSGA